MSATDEDENPTSQRLIFWLFVMGCRNRELFPQPSRAKSHGLLLLLEEILEDELTPSAAACVHQRATLVELSQLNGRKPESFRQSRHRSDRVLVVARQKEDPVPALNDRNRSPGWPQLGD